jgi:hypothetical protein
MSEPQARLDQKPPDQAPTQGQKANVVGKFYYLKPGDFASVDEFMKAKEKGYEEWRNSLQTADDYNTEARGLLEEAQGGTPAEQWSNRDALATIVNDAQAKGIPLAPDVQQGIATLNASENLGPLYLAMAMGPRWRRGKSLQQNKAEAQDWSRVERVRVERMREAPRNKKVRTSEKGDYVRTPDSNPDDFTKLKGNQGWQNNFTDENWRGSNTAHTGDAWKVFDGSDRVGSVSIDGRVTGP